MLTIHGRVLKNKPCLSRREFLVMGGTMLGGFSLADVLAAESKNGSRQNKAVIQIHLDGGPPGIDMIDLKPDAPSEIRGDFKPISTKIPGFAVCELMPKLANNARDFAFIRSLVGAESRHDAFQCQSGFSANDLKFIGGRPAFGSIVSKLDAKRPDRRKLDSSVPFIDLMQGRPLVRNSARPGFLGPAFGPFRPDISEMFARPLEERMKGELASLGTNHQTSLSLHASMAGGRLDQRSELLGQLDQIKRDVDGSGMMFALDTFHQQAADVLTSGRIAAAMDLENEDPKVLSQYTPATTAQRWITDETHYSMRKLLLARRLIEAGAKCVSVSFGDFDTHSDNFTRLKFLLPVLDHGLTTLVTDLRQRGMLDDVLVVAWGEFGRTPKINKNAGRDHWPGVAMAMLAGGGIKTGQVIGNTDRTSSAVTERPIHYQDILAMQYRHLGIDPLATTIVDPTGRPQYLLDRGRPIEELG